MNKEKARAHYEQMEIDATLRMLRDPDSWPRWPLLPMKNRNEPHPAMHGMPKLGFIMPQPSDKPVVLYEGTVMIEGNLTAGEIDTLTKASFTSYEALVAAGWRVD